MSGVALPAEDEFDELFYLTQNRDVRDAVAHGRFASGWQHFRHHGAFERRPWRRRPGLLGLDFAAILDDRRNSRS